MSKQNKDNGSKKRIITIIKEFEGIELEFQNF